MVEVAAVHGTANASLIAGYGYAGILVAFIARQNPLAVIPVAILLGGIGASGGLLQRSFGLPDATVNVLQGILFVVILASDSLRAPARPAPAPGSRPPTPVSRRRQGRGGRLMDAAPRWGSGACRWRCWAAPCASARRSCSSAWASA